MAESGLRYLALALCLVAAAACAAPGAQRLAAGPLGMVVVGEGESVHIRSLGTLTRGSKVGVDSQRGVALAVADYGAVKGHRVTMGAGLDSLCSAAGGAAAAATVVGDRRVVGVIGPSCSVAAATAAPLLNEQGLLLVAPSTTSPSLTSDLAGNAGANNHAGFYRTASNDLYQAQSVADFVFNALGLERMAALHDGDPYTQGLAEAFGRAYEALGGVVEIAMVEKGATDVRPALRELAQSDPEGLFMPVFPEEALFVLRQSAEVEGMEQLVRIGGGALLSAHFLALPESEGLYLAGPELDFGGNLNEATGRSGMELTAIYEAQYGMAPSSPYLAHAYDATTLLLRAIEETAVEVGNALYIDRAALRTAVAATQDFAGIIGTITCDSFGDCGTGEVRVVQHVDSENPDIGGLEVVWRSRTD